MKKNDNEGKSNVVTVKSAREFKNGDVGCTLIINGVTIYNCYYKEVISKKDDKEYHIVQFPQYKASNGEYYNYAYVKLSDDEVEDIRHQILKLL